MQLRLAICLLLLTVGLNGCKATLSSRDVPTQIVYRFDDHRYLTLTGHVCEGAIHYVDERKGLNTEVMHQFARVFLPDITHADNDGDYVFIPYSDVSGFRVSRDGGRTFATANWVGSREFGVDQIKKLTVVNQQAFIELKDGRLFMTSKPFGQGWGLGVIDVENHLPTTVFKHRPEFQDLPTKVPEVKNYKGWTQMRCDPNL
ncbi:T6SS immunity protein Tli3 family protein [Nitrogeniibacter aestuarii]